MAAPGETGTVLVGKTPIESGTGPVPFEEAKADVMLDVPFANGAEAVPLGLAGTVTMPEIPVECETRIVPLE